MFQKKCNTCQLYIPQNRTCQIMIPAMAGKVDPTDHCSFHNDNLLICEICGGGLLEPIIEVVDDIPHVYCANCAMNR